MDYLPSSRRPAGRSLLAAAKRLRRSEKRGLFWAEMPVNGPRMAQNRVKVLSGIICQTPRRHLEGDRQHRRCGQPYPLGPEWREGLRGRLGARPRPGGGGRGHLRAHRVPRALNPGGAGGGQARSQRKAALPHPRRGRRHPGGGRPGAELLQRRPLRALLAAIGYDGPFTVEMIPFSRLPDLVLPDLPLAERVARQLLALQ